MQQIRFWFIFCFMLGLSLMIGSCSKDDPVSPTPKGSMTLTITNDVGEPVIGASVTWTSDLGMEGNEQLSDSVGVVKISDLVAATYHIVATLPVSENYRFQGDLNISLQAGQQVVNTLVVRMNTAGLKINEVYFCGCGTRYFYDQFIELYNGSADTIYLDNSIIFVCTAKDFSGLDSDNDGDLDYSWIDSATGDERKCITYVTKLFGNGTEYPVLPGEYRVVAADAIDHTKNETESFDLSNADFEFTNINFPNDEMNDLVPDYENILLGDCGYVSNLDFMLSLATGFVGIASGEDSKYCDGIDFDTIWDGVEYSRNEDHVQQVDNKLETGFTGVGIESYSRKSIQRIRPGYDTNNSKLDFEILENPTPGSW
ncbi:DUF4876 domain-containing protein [candidate division KSB1 bacterium]|nr:DUF4876 domain-containing protein [candidate division KSB1 bacterium]